MIYSEICASFHQLAAETVRREHPEQLGSFLLAAFEPFSRLSGTDQRYAKALGREVLSAQMQHLVQHEPEKLGELAALLQDKKGNSLNRKRGVCFNSELVSLHMAPAFLDAYCQMWPLTVGHWLRTITQQLKADFPPKKFNLYRPLGRLLITRLEPELEGTVAEDDRDALQDAWMAVKKRSQEPLWGEAPVTQRSVPEPPEAPPDRGPSYPYQEDKVTTHTDIQALFLSMREAGDEHPDWVFLSADSHGQAGWVGFHPDTNPTTGRRWVIGLAHLKQSMTALEDPILRELIKTPKGRQQLLAKILGRPGHPGIADEPPLPMNTPEPEPQMVEPPEPTPSETEVVDDVDRFLAMSEDDVDTSDMQPEVGRQVNISVENPQRYQYIVEGDGPAFLAGVDHPKYGKLIVMVSLHGFNAEGQLVYRGGLLWVPQARKEVTHRFMTDLSLIGSVDWRTEDGVACSARAIRWYKGGFGKYWTNIKPENSRWGDVEHLKRWFRLGEFPEIVYFDEGSVAANEAAYNRYRRRFRRQLELAEERLSRV